MKFVWLLALFALVGVVQAQPFPDRVPFRGVVTDQNGQPIPRATVTFRRQIDKGTFAFWGGEATANERGEFVFSDAESGLYYLNVQAAGFVNLLNLAVDWKRGSAPFRVQLSSLTRLHLAVKHGGVPLANTPVLVRLRSPNSATASQLQEVRRTDANGQVILKEIAPATYSILIQAGEFYGAPPAREIRYSPEGTLVEIAMQQGAGIQAALSDLQNVPFGGAIFGLQVMAPLDGKLRLEKLRLEKLLWGL